MASQQDGNGTSGAKTFRLFDLPPEIRLQIYGYTLKPSKIEVYSFDLSKARGEGLDEVALTPFYAKLNGPKRISPAILRTCKTVYTEAHQLLYEPSALRLRPSFRFNEDTVWEQGEIFKRREKALQLGETQEGLLGPPSPRVFNVSKLSSTRHLNCLQLELYVTYWTRNEDSKHSMMLVESFRDKIRVGTLQLCLMTEVMSEWWPYGVEDITESMSRMISAWSRILEPELVKALACDKDENTYIVQMDKANNGDWTRRRVGKNTEQLPGTVQECCDRLFATLIESFGGPVKAQVLDAEV